MQEETDGDGQERRTHLYVYWGASIFATLVFLLFTYVMMMSPLVSSVDRLWMLSIAAALLAVPLWIGIWKVATTEAAILAWPVGTWVTILLSLEFALCITNIIGVAHHMRHP